MRCHITRIYLLVSSCCLLAAQAHAGTVAHWRFEDDGFLNDSGGANELADFGSVSQVTSPFSSPIPQLDAANADAALFSGSNHLTAADNAAFRSDKLTLEAFFRASDLSGATTTRMIAGVWGTTDAAKQSYLLGTRNSQLLFQFRNGATLLNVSAFSLATNTNYYAAVAVDLADTSSSAITLYLQDQSTGILQVANFSRSVTAWNANTTPFSIGATSTPSAHHVGLIDEVRLSNLKLAQADLLISSPAPPPPPGSLLTWRQYRDTRFGSTVVAEANPYADPDGNGMPNLLEHALGENPNSAGKIQMPVVDFATPTANLTLSYPKAAADVDYFAEWSPNLSSGSWSRMGFSPEIQDPVSEWFSCMITQQSPLPRMFLRMQVGLQDSSNADSYPKANGFRGIWFELGQKSTYGDKYSGGLGTYTANHVPMAHYAPEVNRTYFTFGGTPSGSQRLLHILVSYYDHDTGLVARPVRVMDKSPVNDPHDNASMAIDEEGYIWIFISGRGTIRLGRIYRSKVPYGINDWINLGDSEFTYPQPWWFKGQGFLHTYTRYTNGRELYCRSSRNGTSWNAEKKLAGIGGHYQTSCQTGNRVITAFNRHPNGNVDARTDLYYMETPDMGVTWTTANGTVLTTPLTTAANPARIRNYSSNTNSSDNALVYIHDVTADADGRPVILYITAKDYRPGPNGDPRTWNIARWTGSEWLFHTVTTSTHNYDTGALYIEEDGTWKVIGPTAAGPQYWGAGGEMEVWTSANQGVTWAKQRTITSNSIRNHSYARRPRNAHPDFYAYWADGNADTFSESHLWFTNKAGDKLWRMPYDMTDDFAAPIQIDP